MQTEIIGLPSGIQYLLERSALSNKVHKTLSTDSLLNKRGQEFSIVLLTILHEHAVPFSRSC